MSQSVQNSNFVNSNQNNPQYGIEEVDSDTLEAFSSKVNNAYTDYNKEDSETSDKASESDNQEHQFEKLEGYSEDSQEILANISSMFAESNGSHDTSKLIDYVTTIASQSAPELMSEIIPEFESITANLEDVSAKFAEGNASKKEVEDAIADAGKFTLSNLHKLKSYMNKGQHTSSEKNAAGLKGASAPPSSEEETAPTPAPVGASAPTPAPVGAPAPAPTPSYSYNIGGMTVTDSSSIDGLLASAANGQVSMYVAMIAVLLIVVETSEEIAATQMTVLTTYQDYAAYLNDAETAYNSLIAVSPYTATIDLDGDGDFDSDGETIEIDDMYTIMSIAEISNPNSPYYDPNNDYYDPDLYQQLSPCLNFFEEYYPSEMASMTWMSPDQQADAASNPDQDKDTTDTDYNASELAYAENTFSAMLEDMIDEINYCNEHLDCNTIDDFPSTEVTIEGTSTSTSDDLSYTTYTLDEDVLGTSQEAITTAVETASSASQTQMSVVQVALQAVQDWFGTIKTVLTSMQSTDQNIFR